MCCWSKKMKKRVFMRKRQIRYFIAPHIKSWHKGKSQPYLRLCNSPKKQTIHTFSGKIKTETLLGWFFVKYSYILWQSHVQFYIWVILRNTPIPGIYICVAATKTITKNLLKEDAPSTGQLMASSRELRNGENDIQFRMKEKIISG